MYAAGESARNKKASPNAAAPYIISDMRNLHEKHRSTKGTDLLIISFCLASTHVRQS